MSENTQTPAKRESWSGQTAFLLAAVGSAVGLGNIWRFPGVAYTNGGGAFIIPYLGSLILVGIPVLLLDYSIGHKFRGGAPLALRRLGGKFGEYVGWLQVFVSFFITVYYAVILAWAARYIFYSINQPWTKADSAAGFFVTEFLHLSDPSFNFTPVAGVAIPLAFLWILALFIMALGVSGGVEKANKVFMPLLIALFLAIVVRAVFLPGAVDGLQKFFTPDWSAVGNYEVWLAAITQIFFSLSIGYGIMLTYSSYLKPRSNLVGTGLVAAFANSSFEILAGIGVFSTLGYISGQSGTAIDDMSISGVMLAFSTYPEVISQMPGGQVFGVLFFTSLVFAGLTSLLSLLQVVSSGLQDKFGFSAKKASMTMGIPMAIVSILVFGSASGLNALDTVDDFVNNFAIVFGCILMMVVASMSSFKLIGLRRHLNTVSAVKVPVVWSALAGMIIPFMLAVLLVLTIVGHVREPYGGYPQSYLAVYGWGLLAVILVLAGVLTGMPWKIHKPGAADFDENRGERRGSPMKDLDDGDSIATDFRQAFEDFNRGNRDVTGPARKRRFELQSEVTAAGTVIEGGAE